MRKLTKAQQQERAESELFLRQHLPQHSTLYCILRHVSRSGMTRHIGCVILAPGKDGTLIDFHPNHAIAQVLGWRLNAAGDGVVVDGCGMDMAFHLAETLGRVLYGTSYALTARWL